MDCWVSGPILNILEQSLRHFCEFLYIAHYNTFFQLYYTLSSYSILYLSTLCYWPAPPDDPQGIRVTSVIEFSLCWPAPPTIHRGLEWPQFLNSLIVCSLSACSLFVGKFSNFFLQYNMRPPSRDCSACTI